MKLILPPGSRPPKVDPVEKVKRDRAPLPVRLIVNSDMHFRIADPYYTAALVAFARDFQPDCWVLNGDIYDFWSISRWDKEPERIPDALQGEFDAAQPFLKTVCNISKRVEFIPGNHEYRAEALVRANPGLFGLRALDWHRFADMPEKINVHKYGTRVNIGGITFEHGDRIGGKFGIKHAAEWALANRVGTHTVFGHTHKVEMKHRTVRNEDGEKIYFAANTGHGSDTAKQKYAGPSPDWQHGFLAVEFYTVGGKPRFTPHLVTVTNGVFMFGGKVYDGRRLQ